MSVERLALFLGALALLARRPRQGGGGEAPLFAAPAVAAGPFDPDVAEAGLHGGAVAPGQAAEFVLAVRTPGRGGRGLLLGGLFEHLAEQFVAAAQPGFFEVAEVLAGGAGRSVELSGQAAHQSLALRGQEVFQVLGGGRRGGARGRGHHRRSVPAVTPVQKLICAPRKTAEKFLLPSTAASRY